MAFRAAPSAGRWIGLWWLAAAVALEVALAVGIRLSGPGGFSAVLLLVLVVMTPLTARLAYWVWGCFSLRYALSRNGVEIRWAASHQSVPMSAITRVLAGRPYIGGLHGFHWRGHEVGRTMTAPDGGGPLETLVLATTPPNEQLLIVTQNLAYAISPADRPAFVREFKVRRRLGPVQHVAQETRRPLWARLSLWLDQHALRVLGLAAALCALTFAWLLWRYAGLPEQLAIRFRFDPSAGTSVPGDPRPLSFIWSYPLRGALVLGLNLVLAAVVHGRHRLAALLLAYSALVYQLATAVVLVRVALP